MAEHGNRPIFSTEFGNIVYILADFENRNIVGHGNFEGRNTAKVPILLTLILLKLNCNSISRTQQYLGT